MVNPLELVAKTLVSFGEKELSIQMLLAFGKKAQTFEQYNDIAKILFEIKDFSNAIIYGEKSLKLAKTEQEIHVTTKNLINVYNQNNFPEKALTQISKVKHYNPQDNEILLEESFSYTAIGQHEKAYKILFDLLKKSLSEELERKAYHNISGYYFKKDDLSTGLKHFLKSSETEVYERNTPPPFEKWNGEIKKGKTILIDAQCGAGDEIMHVRFMKNIIDLGMKPIWYTSRQDIKDIFDFNGFNTDVCWENDRKESGPRKDYSKYPKDTTWVYALSLPYELNITVNELGREPYLNPLPEKEKEYEYLKKDNKYKVGVFWNSGSGFEQAHFRSVNAEELLDAIVRDNYSIYSLQLPDEPTPEHYQDKVKTFYIPDRNFTDTFSIVSQMDLVITSCTSIAHIAASQGKETCVLVPIMEYYAWTSSTGKSWWYGDHVHIFKQKKPRCWKKPLKELEEFLNDRGV